MFNKKFTLEYINNWSEDTLMKSIGIEFLEIGKDFLIAKMPVDERTFQHMNLLHGGATAALAETIGSSASAMIIDLKEQTPVGTELNISHIRSARDGWVYGKATPVHIGRTSHIWEIRVTNEESKLVSLCRLTMRIIQNKK